MKSQAGKLKLAFIWYFDKASWVYDNWRDGHRAAIERIAKNHWVGWYLDKTMPDPGEVDFLLFWASSNEDFFVLLDKYTKEKRGLCLTTDPHNVDNLRKMDVVFVESKPIFDQCRALSLPAIRAFGTDTDFFRPDPTKKKDIEFFYPATFSPWKRQRDLAYLGDRLLCVGTIQPDGEEDYLACKGGGVRLEAGYFPVKKILEYYQRSKNVIIPAIHGSERTVLEAMSCNILPTIVYPDTNKRAYSYVVEYLGSGIKSPREFVKKFYSHRIFAKSLTKGINLCLSK